MQHTLPVTRTRFRFFYSRREEEWLNDMAARGWHLTYVSPLWGRYTFTPGQPNGPLVRIDYRRFTSDDELAHYRSLFADAGWHLVPNRPQGISRPARLFPQQYLVRTRPDADEDIFSDDLSRALSHKKAAQWSSCGLLLFLPLLLCIVVNYVGVLTSPINIFSKALMTLVTIYLLCFAGTLTNHATFHWRSCRRLTRPHDINESMT